MMDFNPPEYLVARSPAVAKLALDAGCALPGDGLPDFEPRQSRFKVELFDQVSPLALGWVVKGLWPATGVCLIIGPSMSGKSFLVLDAAARVCLGAPVHGRRSKPCGVLYIASEDPNGIRLRIAALKPRVGPLGPRFALIGQAPNLRDAGDLADLRATVAEVREGMADAGQRLGIVVLDTFSTSIPGADENSAQDMSPVLTALQNLALDFGLLVLVVAHTGKDETRGPRGWSGLLANADGVIQLEKPSADGLRQGSVVKVKNGEAGWRFAFTLEVVELGRDEDGDPITTCIVEEAALPDTGTPAGRPSLSPKQKLILRAVHLCMDAGEMVPMPPGPGIPPDARGVSRAAAKERALREGYADGDEKPESVRRTMNTNIAALITKGILRGQGDYLWLIK